MTKTVKDKARSISKRLSNLSQKLGVTFQDILTEFLLERMVVRLVQDETLASQLVFKGGYVALRAYNSPRFTPHRQRVRQFPIQGYFRSDSFPTQVYRANLEGGPQANVRLSRDHTS